MLMIAMLLWGVYYDLSTFAELRLYSTSHSEEEYASSFGIIDAFISLAYVIALFD